MPQDLIMGLSMVIFFIMFWIAPISVIIKADKCGKNEKIAWIVAAIFISWFAFILYILLAPIKPNDDNDRFRPA